ncbi:unnamed protein product [Brassica oleracea]
MICRNAVGSANFAQTDGFHRRFFRFNRGRLTRQRKLRHLTDDDVLGGEGGGGASTSAVPLPLPLPEVGGDWRNGKGDADRLVPDRTTSGPPLSSTTNGVARDSRRGSENQEFSAPTMSAPATPYVSPPRQTSPFLYLRNQVWSAPDLPFHTDDLSPFSTDNSPIHSPRRPIRPSSPLHPTLSPDVRRESANVHPLPLPPGAPCHLKQDSFPQWKKGKLIGRGTFGSVYVATNSENGALCAMKEVELFPDDPKSAECIKQLEQEIKLLTNLQHPNIVHDRFFIYLEYVHPGSINKYIQDHCGGTMTESVVRNFTRHILSGLAFLHSKKTVHRDIKGANLLVDASGVVKLADFGMAKHLTGQRADLSLKGSPYWMAPELMQAVMQRDSNPDLAFAVDIWSLGCTIIEMFTGKPPWSEFEGAAAMFKVMRDSPPVPETMSAEGKDFLRLCFQRNPAERPTASMLLEHRFLKNSSVLSTSPRNSDVSNCSQLFNGMNITEPNSRREKPNFKLDQVPRARNVTSSERYWQQQQQQQHRSPDVIGTVTRLSPRSTLEAIRSPSPSQQPKAKH